MTLKLLLSGASGRIGREIEALVASDKAFEVVDRADRDRFFDDRVDADALIDFSRPDFCARSVSFAAERGIPCVVGTTGLASSQQRLVEQAAADVAICQAANFSIGVHVLQRLVERAAASLGDSFDVEIAELHHRWKEDAPSGTALALGRAVARSRGGEAPEGATRGPGRREAGEIGFQSGRGGDVAGEHTVHFLGDGERLELTHRAGNRQVFARGALRAARWLQGRGPGLYGLDDLLD